MFIRHQEIEWIAKNLAATMVATMLTDQKDVKSSMVKEIQKWDMDKDPEELNTDDITGSSGEATEADIEAMWAAGAEEATRANENKPSFGSMRLS